MSRGRRNTTDRVKRLVERCGYTYALAERSEITPRGRLSFDLFGFADCLAIKADVKGVLAIQTTVGSSMSEHLKKMQSAGVVENVRTWLEAGNRVEAWGWPDKRRVNPDRVKGGIIVPTFIQVTLADDGRKLDLWDGWTELFENGLPNEYAG